MHEYFTINGLDNVVDMKKYKVFKETKALFVGYKSRILKMDPESIKSERARILKEISLYPNHLLTKVKVQIFENVTKTKLNKE